MSKDKKNKGKPVFSKATVKYILKKDLVFRYNNQSFKVMTMNDNFYTPCMVCNLGRICDENISHICRSFDKYAKGNHYLCLIDN